jgi:hypothetical protein
LVDELGQITNRDGIVGNVRGDDLRRQRQQIVALIRVVHHNDPAVSLISNIIKNRERSNRFYERFLQTRAPSRTSVVKPKKPTRKIG